MSFDLLFVSEHTAYVHIASSRHGHMAAWVLVTDDPFRLVSFLRSGQDFLKTTMSTLDFRKQPVMDHGLHNVADVTIQSNLIHSNPLTTYHQQPALFRATTLLVKNNTTFGHNSRVL